MPENQAKSNETKLMYNDRDSITSIRKITLYRSACH